MIGRGKAPQLQKGKLNEVATTSTLKIKEIRLVFMGSFNWYLKYGPAITLPSTGMANMDKDSIIRATSYPWKP